MLESGVLSATDTFSMARCEATRSCNVCRFHWAASFVLARAKAISRYLRNGRTRGCEQGMMQFDDAQLLQYIDRFYGYGNYSGRHWLVGMEEGGGNSPAEIASRLNTWQKRGKPELDDVLGFHQETGLDRWFRPNPPLQPTWAKLI